MIELNYGAEGHDHSDRYRVFYIDPGSCRAPRPVSRYDDQHPFWVADSDHAPLGSTLPKHLVLKNYQPVWNPGPAKMRLS